MLRWLIVPVLVGVSMLVLTLLGWFQNQWILLLFALVSVASLLMWRRATYRLSPSIFSLKDADEQTKNLVGSKVQIVFAISIAISSVAGLFLFVSLILEYDMPYSVLILIVGWLAWSSIVQHGACNLVCYHYMSRNSKVANEKVSGF